MRLWRPATRQSQAPLPMGVSLIDSSPRWPAGPKNFYGCQSDSTKGTRLASDFSPRHLLQSPLAPSLHFPSRYPTRASIHVANTQFSLYDLNTTSSVPIGPYRPSPRQPPPTSLLSPPPPWRPNRSRPTCSGAAASPAASTL